MKNRIREYLDRKHMSQRELAERLDVTEVTISRYVTGMREPKLKNALMIAKELGCTVEELFDIER